MTDTVRNRSVDTFRLLAALCVIVLHIQYPDVSRSLVTGARLMSRWAIPFFFIISGYFLAAKSLRTKRLETQPVIERLGWIFLLWILIYIPVTIIGDHIKFTAFFRDITSSDLIFYGNFYHLWFVSSMLFGYLFIAVCYRYNVKFLLPIFSIISLVIALISGAYDIFNLGFNLGFYIPRHWLAIPFLYIGILLFEKGRPNWKLSALLAVFGAGLQIIEARFLYDQFGLSAYKHQFLIGTIPFAIGLACLALSDLKFLQHPLLAKWGSEYSLGIYLIHPMLAYAVSGLIHIFIPALGINAIWQIVLPATLLFLSVLVWELLHRYWRWGYNLLLGIRAPAKEIT